METMLFRVRKAISKSWDRDPAIAEYNGHLAVITDSEEDKYGRIEVEFSDGVQHRIYRDELMSLHKEEISEPVKKKVYVYRLHGLNKGKLVLDVTETEAVLESLEMYKIPLKVGLGLVTLNSIGFDCWESDYNTEAYYVSTEKQDDMERKLKSALRNRILNDRQRYIDMFGAMLELL